METYLPKVEIKLVRMPRGWLVAWHNLETYECHDSEILELPQELRDLIEVEVTE